MRIGGLASGMDIDQIVGDLMKAERMPLDRFFQRKQTIEWKRDAFRDVNLKLDALDKLAFSMTLRSSLNTRQATSSDDSKFTATANPSVREGTYNVEITQVATKTNYISAATITSGSKIDPSQTLADQSSKFSTAPTDGSQFKITTSAGTKTFTVDTSKSLNALFKEINDSTLGVRAYYDSAYDKVVFESKETGANTITLSDTSGFLENVLKLSPTTPSQQGVDAQVKFTDPTFGTVLTQTSKSNSVTIGGITIKATATGIGTVTVSSNTDQAYQNIKSFVDKYNEIVLEMNKKLSEPSYRDYQPLTDEQRKDLSEKEAEMWDEKAKSGLLRKDSILSSFLSKMRSDIYAPVSTTGQYDQLAQIGITTTKNYKEGGVLEINETKLRDALKNDPDSVHQLLNSIAEKSLTDIPEKDRTLTQKQTIYNQTGLIGRLRSTIKDSIDEIVERAGNSNKTNQNFILGRELLSVNKQIDSFQDRLTRTENRYWRQFTAMEKAIQKANSQSAYLMQQFG